MDTVDSALSTILDDSERIADNLIPPGSSVEKVLGVLVIQIEKALGGKITALTDKELGISEKEAPSKEAASSADIQQANRDLGVTEDAASRAEKIAAIKARADEEIAAAEAAS